jgi:hypothetical protein
MDSRCPSQMVTLQVLDSALVERELT